MFGKFFDRTPVDELVRTLLDVMKRTLPPQNAAEDSKRAERLRKELDEKLRRKVNQAARGARLNIYQKAKLGPALEEAMRTAGYPQELCKSLSYDIVKLVAQATAAR